MKKRTLVALAIAGVLSTALPLAAAPTGTWTAVASTGVPDESAAGIYAAGGSNLGYGPAGSVAPIVVRYNVTNTWSLSDTPPWAILELGYFDNSPSSAVRAELFQVDPCTGSQTVVCSVVSADNGVSTCQSCQFAPSINFASKLYYVQVTISRSTTAVNPQALTLRIR
jgi:hypothetical protein